MSKHFNKNKWFGTFFINRKDYTFLLLLDKEIVSKFALSSLLWMSFVDDLDFHFPSRDLKKYIS